MGGRGASIIDPKDKNSHALNVEVKGILIAVLNVEGRVLLQKTLMKTFT